MKRICQFLIFTVVSTSVMLAQRPMTVAELSGFIKSSVENRLDDKSIADTLKKIKLTEKLEPRKVNELMSLGAGVRTSAALRELATSSENLPPPAAPAPAPVKPKPLTLTEPDSVEREKILDAVRDYALTYTQNLPNFICNQVIRRQVDSTGTGEHYRSDDKIQEQLTYYEHKEKYKVIALNGNMVENKDPMKMGGAMSFGEFGSMMDGIFEPSTAAEFEWTRLAKWDGVIMNVFSYRVSQERSNYTITSEGERSIISGYHGLVYARQDNNSVARITLECDTIPASYPVQDVKLDLRYGTVKISDRAFILPTQLETRSRDGRMLALNTAEFALYRKYQTESEIKFETDDNDDKKDEKKPPAPVVKKQP
jgi:hypothetical protein